MNPKLAQKELKYPCITRFGSNYIMLDRAMDLKGPMKETVIDERFEQCSAYDAEITQLVLSDCFWRHVHDACSLMAPTYFFIRDTDAGSGLSIGDIYLKIRKMGEQILAVESNDAQAVYDLYQERVKGTSRKVGFHSPVHSAAMLLHPKHWETNFEVELGLEQFSAVRADFMQVLSRVCWTEEEGVRALLQYDNDYKQKQIGYFQQALVQKSAKHADASWWYLNGVNVPELKSAASRILSMGYANSAAERNWSAHSFLHSKSRSGLGFDRQQKLVNVFCNTKLKAQLEKKEPVDYGTDEEFGEEKEFENEQQQEEET